MTDDRQVIDITLDGDCWSVLLGDDLQSGVSYHISSAHCGWRCALAEFLEHRIGKYHNAPLEGITPYKIVVNGIVVQ